MGCDPCIARTVGEFIDAYVGACAGREGSRSIQEQTTISPIEQVGSEPSVAQERVLGAVGETLTAPPYVLPIMIAFSTRLLSFVLEFVV
jgi:hypothetical protein